MQLARASLTRFQKKTYLIASIGGRACSSGTPSCNLEPCLLTKEGFLKFFIDGLDVYSCCSDESLLAVHMLAI
jgi:hypothetical protein